jgi:hypothetical protein
VPLSVIAHDGDPGAFAFPVALHMIVDPLNDPCAVPLTFRSFAHVALNDPFAVVAVCSVTLHLKSVHDEGDGTTVADDHVPISALMPEVDGAEGDVLCSNPMQPAKAERTAKPQARMQFFMGSWWTFSQGALS